MSTSGKLMTQEALTQLSTEIKSYVQQEKPSVPTAYSNNPEMNGTANSGSSTSWAKGDHVHPTDTTRAPLDSPAFTGTPTAPTAAAGTDSTQIATTAFVKTAVADGMAAAGALTYKGTISGGNTGSYGALTPVGSKGDVYVVTTAGKLDGTEVQIGNMIICNADVAAATSSNYSTIVNNWDFVQANNDGVVIGPASSTDSHIALFNGTTGTLLKNSSKSLNDLVSGVSVSGNYIVVDKNGSTTNITVPYATNAGTASACSGNAATATTASACSGNAATATSAASLVRSLAGSGTIAATNIVSVTGSTDGFKIDYSATTSDLGKTTIYTTDDANAVISIGNNVSGTYKEAISIANGSATINGSLTGNVTGNCSGTSSNVTGTVAVANGGTGATTIEAARASLRVPHRPDNGQLGNQTPFSAATSYFTDSVDSGTTCMYYNTSGDEESLIFSKNNNSWGNILKWGNYDDYLYIAHRKSGNWNSSNNWIKISAGYADVAGACSGNANNVDGIVTIEHGGTGANTRLQAFANLTSQNVGTDTKYFISISENWGKAGYCSIADAKTVLGLNQLAIANGGTGSTTAHGAFQNLTNESFDDSTNLSKARHFIVIDNGWNRVGHLATANVCDVIGATKYVVYEAAINDIHGWLGNFNGRIGNIENGTTRTIATLTASTENYQQTSGSTQEWTLFKMSASSTSANLLISGRIVVMDAANIPDVFDVTFMVRNNKIMGKIYRNNITRPEDHYRQSSSSSYHFGFYRKGLNFYVTLYEYFDTIRWPNVNFCPLNYRCPSGCAVTWPLIINENFSYDKSDSIGISRSGSGSTTVDIDLS